MGKRTKKPQLRTVKIPERAAATGRKLYEEQASATRRLNDWGTDTVAAMSIGDLKEGHEWLVDPSKGVVHEVPSRQR